ncbi:Uncharacterized protein DUF547 [Chitinispirillum alkaliphilum]|nr:Uncharacterized protein DUF547 [Chitinispirillum alkaliphilum]
MQYNRIKKPVISILFLLLLFREPLSSNHRFYYTNYEQILSSYVSENGLVDYYMLQMDRYPLDKFILSLGFLDSTVFSRWTREEKVAFYINAYNAIVLRIVIDHYPLRPMRLSSFRFPMNSILQIGNVFKTKPFNIMGEELTLDQIENILTQKLDEPKVRFALVRGSQSCPPLRNVPYTGELLYSKLDDQIEKILLNPGFFFINTMEDVVYISAILKNVRFNKYGFSPQKRGLLHRSRKRQALVHFLSRYVYDSDRKYLLNSEYQIKFFPMNWTLNDWN